MKTNERLKLRESHFAVQIASENWFAEASRDVMSSVDGALHLVGKPALSETELAKLRDKLRAVRVSHNLPKLDPRTNPTLGEGESLPSIPSFNQMLGEIKEALFVKKDTLAAENRIEMRMTRGFGKARKALHNLLRDHGASARRALEAGTASWILRSVAVASK